MSGLIVRSHHERWDGGGYPDGLAGEEIPLEARIVSCCDSWNAMRTDRAYRKALAPEVALEELSANAGRQFDPHIVEVITAIVGPTAEEPAPAPVPAAARPAQPQPGRRLSRKPPVRLQSALPTFPPGRTVTCSRARRVALSWPERVRDEVL